jgi:hypothetical protein
VPDSHFQCEHRQQAKNCSVTSFIDGLRQEGKLRVGAQAHEGQPRDFSRLPDLYGMYRVFCSLTAGVPHVSQQTFVERMDGLTERFGFRLLEEETGTSFKYLTVADDKTASPRLRAIA